MKIGIIDYGMGNLKSVYNALNHLGTNVFISSSINELRKADKIILPGVGAFKDAITQIKNNKLNEFIGETVKENKPLLGICLGMQLLFETSYEFGEWRGLCLLKGEIEPFKQSNLKIPHMGWNTLDIAKDSKLLHNIPDKSYVYFVHSYHLNTKDDIVIATTNYGDDIQIAVQKNNIYGLQFHPEKSGDIGLEILKNFINI